MAKSKGGETGATVEIGRVIRSEACVAEGCAWLAERVPQFAKAQDMTGPVPLRLKADGFGALLDAIVGQQVSTAAAAAISARLKAAGLTKVSPIRAASEEDLRAVGLSRQKVRYAKALAEAEIDYGRLRAMPSEQIIKELVAVPGIGVWTAEIYCMFSLGRADVFAPGDLALQEAARLLFELPERPKPKELRGMAEDWAPWRSVAARLLWAYYHVAKKREGIR